jgi:O-antigen ligase
MFRPVRPFRRDPPIIREAQNDRPDGSRLRGPSIGGIAGLHSGLTIAVAGLAPAPYGSVEPFWIAVWVLTLAAALAIAPAHVLNERQCRVIASIIGLWLVYLGIALLQVLPDPPFLAHEAWREAAERLGVSTPERISVRASIPLEALGHALLAILAFCNGFVVGAQKERARRLLDGVAVAGLLLALYAIFAELVMPSRLLFRAKTTYVGDITGTFVNRNTAATFFGVISTLWLFSAIRAFVRIRVYASKLLLIVPQNEAAVRSSMLRMIAVAICIAALLGTRSRGGMLALGAGLASSVAIVAIARSRWLLLLGSGGLALLVYGLGGVMRGRVESEGLFDGGRWTTYLSAWRLVTEHPWLGTGLGTFRDVFPSVRSGAASTGGVWDMAHDTILEIAVEMGLPMALAIIAAAVWIVCAIYRTALARAGRSRADLMALASISILTFAHSMMDFSLQIPGFLTLFAILFGAAAASSAAIDEKAESEESAESAATVERAQSDASERPTRSPRGQRDEHPSRAASR